MNYDSVLECWTAFCSRKNVSLENYQKGADLLIRKEKEDQDYYMQNGFDSLLNFIEFVKN